MSAYREARGLVALLGWDWYDCLNALESESEEVLVEFLGILFDPNPFEYVPTGPDDPYIRHEALARMAIRETNEILLKRRQR